MKSAREQMMLFRIVDRDVRSAVIAGDADLKRYFQEHRDRFALSEEYTLSQILIKPRSSDDTADAKEKVREVMTRLKQGTPSRIWRCAFPTAPMLHMEGTWA